MHQHTIACLWTCGLDDMKERRDEHIYKQRVHEVEKGSFTPLGFTTPGGMGKAAKITYKRLDL